MTREQEDVSPNGQPFDVAIVGGGPAGLSAALTLGRARKRVLLCDGGPRRNAAAEHVQGFVTRDGITPEEFRRIGREQLEPYVSVQIRDARVDEICGERGAFDVRLDTGEAATVRRVLLCTGMIDELPSIEGLRALWGPSIFACPYCHGWEVQDRAFGYLALRADAIEFALFLRGWTSSVVVLTDGRFAVPEAMQPSLARAGVRVEERRIARLSANGDRLAAIEFEQGSPLPLDVLVVRPPQRQVAIVQSLAVALNDNGYVVVNEHRETSVPGIHAAGDLVAGVQSAISAAASGMQAAALLNHALTVDLAANGALP